VNELLTPGHISSADVPHEPSKRNFLMGLTSGGTVYVLIWPMVVSDAGGGLSRGALRGTPGSGPPQPEPNATELPSSAPGRPKLIETQSYRPPSLRPRRHAPRKTSPRRRAMDLQAIQATEPPSTLTRNKEHIATTPGCRTHRRAEDRAPPRPRPPARAEENFARLPHEQRVSNVQRAYEETVRMARVGLELDPREWFLRDQTCASWCSRLPNSR